MSAGGSGNRRSVTAPEGCVMMAKRCNEASGSGVGSLSDLRGDGSISMRSLASLRSLRILVPFFATTMEAFGLRALEPFVCQRTPNWNEVCVLCPSRPLHKRMALATQCNWHTNWVIPDHRRNYLCCGKRVENFRNTCAHL